MLSLTFDVFTNEAVTQRCSLKKMFLEISQNSQGNTCARVSFLIKLQASGLSYRTPLVAASITNVLSKMLTTASKKLIDFPANRKPIKLLNTEQTLGKIPFKQLIRNHGLYLNLKLALTMMNTHFPNVSTKERKM